MKRYYIKPLPQLAKVILNHETIDKKYEYETVFFSNMANKRSYDVTFDSLLQHCSNSGALAMESLQSCTNPSIWKKERWLILMRALEWRVCDNIILSASPGLNVDVVGYAYLNGNVSDYFYENYIPLLLRGNNRSCLWPNTTFMSEQMADILQTTFSYTFSWMKILYYEWMSPKCVRGGPSDNELALV